MDTGIALLFMQGHRCRRRRRKQTERKRERESRWKILFADTPRFPFPPEEQRHERKTRGRRDGGGVHFKDTRKERSSRRRFGTTLESRENIRANKRGGNYRALVDGCFCRARAPWNGLGDRVVYGQGIKGSREVQSMKGLDVKPLRVAIFSTLGRSATATVPRLTPKPRPFHLSSNHLPPSSSSGIRNSQTVHCG